MELERFHAKSEAARSLMPIHYVFDALHAACTTRKTKRTKEKGAFLDDGAAAEMDRLLHQIESLLAERDPDDERQFLYDKRGSLRRTIAAIRSMMGAAATRQPTS
jgi:hypothetical protein